MAEHRWIRILDAFLRRLGDTFAKASGREPYLSWSDLRADWAQGFRVLMTPGGLETPPEASPGLSPDLSEPVSGTDCARIRLQSGEVLCWPCGYSTDVLGQVERELSAGDPHNYFDLYQPAQDDVVFDVGSCEGLFAYRAVRAGARVYAFEPLDQLTRALELTFAAEIEAGIIEVHALAFGEAAGEMTLMVDDARPECTTSDLALEGYADKSGFKPVRMLVDTVDAFVARERIERLDCIKLDIESAEMAALLGAQKTLQTLRPRVLVALYHRPEDIRLIPAFLAGLGYQIVPGALTYYPAVRLTRRADTPRPHYRPHVILALHPTTEDNSSSHHDEQQNPREDVDHG